VARDGAEQNVTHRLRPEKTSNARLALFASWLGLVLYLGVMTLQTESLFIALAR